MLIGHPVFWILVAAVVAPLLAEIPTGFKVPMVVLEVMLGVVLGPHTCCFRQSRALRCTPPRRKARLAVRQFEPLAFVDRPWSRRGTWTKVQLEPLPALDTVQRRW
jgi:Kef-type K+ transport system membrane component KefB